MCTCHRHRTRTGVSILTGFHKRVYQLVARIPEGKVATYGQLAAICGHPRGARTVGWALHGAPPDLRLPCHRVVNRTGVPAPVAVFGGPEVQRAMLEAEGVTFLPDGRIDVQKHLWEPAALPGPG